MAVYLPIISEFNGKGIARAKREFKSLDGVAAKTGYVLKKAFLPATAAVGALAAASMKAVDAALEDQKAQVELARVMRTTLNATDAQIAATEEFITAQGRLLGITDDDLRPALAKLFRVTRDVGKSYKIVALAMDIARATGRDLGSTTDALAKALAGNMKPLRSLAPELQGLIKSGASVDEVFQKLGETFAGSASKYAETAAGRMEILKLRFSELFEELGYAILPAFEKLMPYFEQLATWLEQNPDKVAAFAQGMGRFAEAMFEVVGSIGRMLDGLRRGFEDFLNWLIGHLNNFLDAADVLLGPLINIGAIPNVSFGGDQSQPAGPTPFGRMVREARGGSAQAAQGRYLPPGVQGPVITNSPTNVTVNVNGGDPRAVVDAVVRWSRQNGKLPRQVQTAY